MNPVRVLQITDNMNRGGIETFIMNVYRSLDRDKIQFDFLISEPSKCDYEEEILSLGGRIFKIPPKSHGLKQFIKNSNAFAKDYSDYTTIHIHSSSVLSSLSWLFTNFRKHPHKLLHSHNTESPRDLKGFSKKVGQFFLQRGYQGLFACSMAAGEWMFGKQALKTPHYQMIKNGIDPAAFYYEEETRKKLREALNIDQQLVIGHIGRFNEQKNHAFILETFKNVHDADPEAVLLLIGQGELLEEMQEKSKNLGLVDAVRFLGVRRDINELLNAMDIFFMPSLFEGLPVVGVEAQATGLPLLLSSNITPEVDISGQALFKSLEAPIEEWCEALLTVSGNDRKAAARNIIEKGYSIKGIAKELADIYLKGQEKEDRYG